MKLHQLRNLVAVAKAHSIRGAARDQGLAQPAITRGLRELEKELGVPLLERHGNNVLASARSLGISRATLHRRLKAAGWRRPISACQPIPAVRRQS